ncbi:translocation/assembly module TamB domain-containing protein [Sagittula sp. NFXS13]|uniref:translocation/assembly module TamB domain-containing protein n=1 Tax=Sagittula sp. NFXS13 TaxID=2819095 RepID=UPI0032DF2884
MRWLVICLTLLCPLAAAAQGDDRGFIQGLLEDALSNDNMTVRLEGFAGALSSRATVERITIADPQGVWLTAEEVGLQWNRSALLRGAVDIQEISMQRLSIPRLPNAPAETPAPEARSSFALPDLPVSLNLEQLDVARVELGEAVAGIEATLQVSGSASLAGGEGEAQLKIDRLDRGGTIALDGSYSNNDRVLGLDLSVTEPADGLIVNALGVPGAPSVALTVKGDSPIDDFAAAISLSTDGQERISGDVILRADGDAGTNRFRVDIGGDLAALVAPQYEEFLGDDVQLAAEVLRQQDGEIELSEMTLRANALGLSGYALIGADGWPQRLDLDGSITPPSGETVVLPLGGDETRVEGVTLTGTFDAENGNGWQLQAQVVGLNRDGVLELDRLDFTGAGEIARETQAVSGVLDMQAQGLTLEDEVLARTVGSDLRGQVGFDWQKGAPLQLRELDLAGADYGLTGSVTVKGLESLEIVVTPDLVLKADDLGRFAEISGLALTGAADVSITGEAQPLTGAFDLALDGTTRGLGTGIEALDPLIDGVGSLRLEARRDETGLYADLLRIATQAARIEGTAELTSGTGKADLDVTLRDTSLVLPGVEGQTDLTLTAVQQPNGWKVDLDGEIPDVATVQYSGLIDPSVQNGPDVSGVLNAQVGRMSPFSRVAGRALSGAATLTVTGEGRVAAQTFDVEVDARTVNLKLDLPTVDPLLEGTSQLSFKARRGDDKRFVLDGLTYDGLGTIRLDGTLEGASVDDLSVDGRLVADLPRLSPLSGLAGRAVRGALRADVTASGGVLDGPLELSGMLSGSGISLSVPAVDPLLAGDVRLAVEATRDAQGVINVQRLDLDGPATAQFTGTVSGIGEEQLKVDGQASGQVPNLSAFNGLTGQRLSGSLRFDADVALAQPNGPVSANGTLVAQNLGIGNASVDPFLRGTTNVALNVQRDAGGALRIERLTVDGASIDGSVTGRLSPSDANLDLQVTVAGIERLVPELPGSLRVSGTARHSGGDWRVNLDGTGPGRIGARVNGTVAQNFGTVNIDVTGSAPLALANSRIAPNTISGVLDLDVAVRGAPRLENVSGRVSTSGARFSATAFDISLDDLSGGVSLQGGRAQMDLTGSLSSGGTVSASGPILLSAPYGANLVVELRNAGLQQTDLFDTTANGRITIEGPLTGGARIAGRIDLGEVEVRVPTIGPSYSALDGLRHENLPADVRRTLMFANLGPSASGETEKAKLPPYPLDILVSAPNRIFVRGRGLDAELGGSLRLTGTSANVIPIGQFDLVRGRLDLLGRRLDLTQGQVSMRGSFTPYVLFEASTEVEETTITILLEGPVSEPELTVNSSPELPQDEALAFFLFGRSVTDLSPLQAVQLAQAVRTLSGQGGLGIQENIRSGLGVDDFDVGTTDDGTVEASVGKYISDNIYTDVTVGADGTSEINLNLTVTPEVTVRGRVSSDGTSGVGVYYEKDY